MTQYYPADDLDRPEKLLGLMGSLWTEGYSADTFPQDYVRGLLALWKQVQIDAEEAMACLGRQTTPVWHTERWYPLALRSDERRAASLYRFGTTHRYGDGLTYAEAGTQVVYPLPEGIVAAALVQDRIATPQHVWFPGIDYQIDEEQRVIWFATDPLSVETVETRQYVDKAGQTIIEGTVWLSGARQDNEHMYLRWGFPWQYRRKSSPGYSNTINALWDAACDGGSFRAFIEIVAALLDAPLAASTEIVEAVFRDANGLCIVTDKRVYRYHRNAEAVVAVGDKVQAGQPLTDVLLWHECSRGGAPSWMTGVEYSPAMLGTGYRCGVVFRNQTVPTTVSTDADGRTVITWPLGGRDEDVALFWQETHERGVLLGRTLARILDQRTEATTEPPAEALPATINPLQFACDHLLRNHGLLLRLRPHCSGRYKQPLTAMRLAKHLLPAHVLLLMLVVLEAEEEIYSLSGEAATGNLQIVPADAGESYALPDVQPSWTCDTLCE